MGPEQISVPVPVSARRGAAHVPAATAVPSLRLVGPAGLGVWLGLVGLVARVARVASVGLAAWPGLVGLVARVAPMTPVGPVARVPSVGLAAWPGLVGLVARVAPMTPVGPVARVASVVLAAWPGLVGLVVRVAPMTPVGPVARVASVGLAAWPGLVGPARVAPMTPVGPVARVGLTGLVASSEKRPCDRNHLRRRDWTSAVRNRRSRPYPDPSSRAPRPAPAIRSALRGGALGLGRLRPGGHRIGTGAANQDSRTPHPAGRSTLPWRRQVSTVERRWLELMLAPAPRVRAMAGRLVSTAAAGELPTAAAAEPPAAVRRAHRGTAPRPGLSKMGVVPAAGSPALQTRVPGADRVRD